MTPTFALLSLLAMQGAAQTPSMPLLDQHDLGLAMARIASEHPKLVAVTAVGESRAKRRIEALRFPADTPDPGRPAVLIVANIDGPLAWTSSLVERRPGGGQVFGRRRLPAAFVGQGQVVGRSFKPSCSRSNRAVIVVP